MVYYTKQEKVLFKELSTDSRATVTHLAKSVGCSRVTLIKFMDKLVKKLDIKFTLEINMDKLGLSERYIVAVKFKKVPDENILRKIFSNDPVIQSAYLMKGTFDLLIYAVAGTAENYIRWETKLAEDLSQFGARVMPSRYVFSHIGHFPLDDSFTDLISDDYKLDKKDKQLLRLLNSYSRASYKELGDRIGMGQTTTRYRLFRLLRRGIISRFTVAAQSPGEGYSSFVYLINYVFTKTTSTVAFPTQRNYCFTDDDSGPMFNTFQLMFPISGSFRSFGMVLCEDRKTAYHKAVSRHKVIYKNENISIMYGEVVKPLKGIMPFRNIDLRTNYKYVHWHGPTI
jgi:DNA-binding Lrp family transcriptional regulator